MTTLAMTIDGVVIYYPRGAARDVRAIWRAADEGGTIQAGDMARLFPGEPTRHAATSLHNALAYIGAETEYAREARQAERRRMVHVPGRWI